MNQILKRMLMEMGLQMGLILIQRFSQYVERSVPVAELETRPRRRSTDIPLVSVPGLGSNAKPT